MIRFNSRNRRDGVTSRLRLRDYDYASPGYYFVTMVCHDRAMYFGTIRGGQMEYSAAGKAVDAMWNDVPATLLGVTIDCQVVMPNHVHVLVGIGVELSDPEERASLKELIHWYKSITTTQVIKGVKELGWPRFDRHLWQSGFHDRIVRNERELETLRRYIATNPELWDEDTFYSEL